MDEEVENIVHTLNRFSPFMKTTRSCSGHNKRQAWVSLSFARLRELNDFIDVFDPYKCKIDLVSSIYSQPDRRFFHEKPFFPGDVFLALKTKDIGKPAYRALDEFDRYLRSVINLRDRSNVLLDELIEQEKTRLGYR